MCVLRHWPSVCGSCAEQVNAECARGGPCTHRGRDELTEAETNAPAVYGGVELLALLTAHTRGGVEMLPSEILTEAAATLCAPGTGTRSGRCNKTA